MTSFTGIRRGVVALVYFPYTNHRQVKRRPALVVGADGLHTGFPNVAVVEISSNLGRLGPVYRIPVRTANPYFPMTGLAMDSVIMTDNIMTIESALIAQPIGLISDMSPVDVGLRITLAL